MNYLDPKNDLTFKKVFGQHPHLLISFLNAMLPLPEGSFIESLEYLPAEMVPETPLMKFSIVDVRCKDNFGRQFIVEMQMNWTTGFMQRVLFNASKAYIKQLDKTFNYNALQPVYALNLINEVFETEKSDFYHHYQIVNIADTEKQLEGLEFVFIELPKFKADKISEKKLQVLWLRFLTEIDESITEVPEELLNSNEIKEALENLRTSAFTKAELESYDKYWDGIRTQITLEWGKFNKGMTEGIEKGRAEGKAEGKAEERIAIAKNGILAGLSNEIITALTQLTPEQIAHLRKEMNVD
ncbi:MAG: Rpn family recombination-promoting nuclease/putative transposase [Bacteroidales bacterium]|nr:Rpn family recombination-promoting nuclease/putative transposase [Bacteroidales bacterium]